MAEQIITGQTPQTVVSSGREDYGYNAHMFNLVAAKDSQRETVESRHQIERAVKESELATERAKSAVLLEVSNLRNEFNVKLAAENAVTRAMISEMGAKALQISAIELLMRQLLPKQIVP